ncbi:MAG: hypothetical protein V4637_19850, partial [Pseudomonadota bacterium]
MLTTTGGGATTGGALTGAAGSAGAAGSTDGVVFVVAAGASFAAGSEGAVFSNSGGGADLDAGAVAAWAAQGSRATHISKRVKDRFKLNDDGWATSARDQDGLFIIHHFVFIVDVLTCSACHRTTGDVRREVQGGAIVVG